MLFARWNLLFNPAVLAGSLSLVLKVLEKNLRLVETQTNIFSYKL